MGSVSMNYLTNLLGPNAPLAATFIVAFAAVLVLIGLTAWIFRLLRGRGLGIGSGGRGRQPRLAVLDYADVDQRRKLVLIRRDNVEHLLLLGGPTDVVVETSIVRGMPVQASALTREPAAPAPAYVEPDPPVPQPRPSLRDGLVRLEERGLIRTSRDGARVARFLEPLSAPLFELFADKPRVSADYFEYRRMIEVEASRLAALRATDVDRELIRSIVGRMRAAHELDDPTQESDVDAELHLAIYEAAHNVVMLHVMRVLSEMLRNNIFYNRDQLYQRDGARDQLLAQHLAIAEAILAGNPAGAAQAAENHIRFTVETVEEIRRDAERLADSLRRLDRADILAAPSKTAAE